MKGSIMMCDYWIKEVVLDNKYQVNEIYFDAGDAIQSTVIPEYSILKSNQVAHMYTSGIRYQESYQFAVADRKDIYLIKKYYDGNVGKIREWYLGKYKF